MSETSERPTARPAGRGPDLGAQLRTGAELLRPHPHRGDLIAAGAVPLTVAVLLINLRMDESWGTGIFLVLSALACVVVLAMGVLAPREGERPRAYQAMLQLCGLALLLVALLRLAQVLGVDEPLDADGSAFWILTVVALAAAWLARERRTAVCALVAGVAGVLALLSLVEWVFSPEGGATNRWILLLAALGLVVGALLLRDRHRRESVYLVDAAGVAMVLLGISFLGEFLVVVVTPFGEEAASAGPSTLWKVVLLAAGFGLVAYAGVDREPGPAWLGTLVLLEFVVLDAFPGEGGASLWFWPLVLLAVGAAMIGAGLRPRRDLPPEPGPAGAPGQVVPGPTAPAGPAAAAATPPAAPVAATPPAPAAEPASRRADEGEFLVERPAPPEPAAIDEPASVPPATEPPDPADAPTQAQPPVDPAPRAEPEPPARGSLWARPDPGQQPTQRHELPPRPADPGEGGRGA